MTIVKISKGGVIQEPPEKSTQAQAGKGLFYFPSLDVLYAHLQDLTRAAPGTEFNLRVDPGEARKIDLEIIEPAPKPADPQ